VNILITGSKGYIGKSLVEILEKKYNIFELKNSSNYLSNKNIYNINLLDIKQIELFLKEDISIDIIIHTAAKMAFSSNIDDLGLLYDNIKIYEHLVQIAKYAKVKKIINLSSTAVYPNADAKYDEESIIKPSVNNDALYGLSKFCGENILDHLLKDFNTKIIHLRISQVYSDDLRDDRLYIMMKNELLKTNKITVYGNGERVSNFIHKDLLIKKIIFFIEKEYYGVFNIGDKNLSYKEFADKIIKQFGNKDSEIKYITNGMKSRSIILLDKFNELVK